MYCAEQKLAEVVLKRSNIEFVEKIMTSTDELYQEKGKLNGIPYNTADDIRVIDPQNKIVMANPVKEEKAGSEFELECKDSVTSESGVLSGNTSCMKNSEEEIVGVITTLNDSPQLLEVDRLQAEFVSMIAHEMRIPLTSIQGFSEILLTQNDIEEKKKEKLLFHINRQSMALASIVDDLLNISRIESGLGFTLNKAPIRAGEIVEDMMLYFQEQFPEYRFKTILPDEDVELVVDKDKIEQVLKNMLSNAVKYSPEGSMIQITGEVKMSDSALQSVDLKENKKKSKIQNPKSKTEYQVSVEDQGIGMTPEQVKKIFDKFYRANSSIEGTGLGMSIVKYLVEAHGGRVWLESEFVKGTIVRFTIPI